VGRGNLPDGFNLFWNYRNDVNDRGQIGKGPGGTREKRRGKLGAKAMGTGGKASSGFRVFQFLALANKRAKNAAKKKN